MLRGEYKYHVAGVSPRDLRSYEITQVSGDVVSVRVTMAGKLGNDIVQTKKFRVDHGHLLALDERDKVHEIGFQLYVLALQAREMVAAGRSLEDITFAALCVDRPGTSLTTYSFAGESYDAVKFKLVNDKIIAALMFEGTEYTSDYLGRD